MKPIRLLRKTDYFLLKTRYSLRNIEAIFYPDSVLVNVVKAVASDVIPLVNDQRFEARSLARLLPDHAAGQASPDT